jgi:hypothetical protein
LSVCVKDDSTISVKSNAEKNLRRQKLFRKIYGTVL